VFCLGLASHHNPTYTYTNCVARITGPCHHTHVIDQDGGLDNFLPWGGLKL
jgi:hypothetical protein